MDSRTRTYLKARVSELRRLACPYDAIEKAEREIDQCFIAHLREVRLKNAGIGKYAPKQRMAA